MRFSRKNEAGDEPELPPKYPQVLSGAAKSVSCVTCDDCLLRSSSTSGAGVGKPPNEARLFEIKVVTGTLLTARADAKERSPSTNTELL